MSSLKTNEKQILEKIFQMQGWYVLNFSDRKMNEFFKDNLSIDIYCEAYKYSTGSKANYMRGFWNVAENDIVWKSILELIEYIENEIVLWYLNKEDFNEIFLKKGQEIWKKLLGNDIGHKEESEFLK